MVEPCDNQRLSNLIGRFDKHLKLIALRFNMIILTRGNIFQIQGEQKAITKKILEQLYQQTAQEEIITTSNLHLLLQQYQTYTSKKHHLRTELKSKG